MGESLVLDPEFEFRLYSVLDIHAWPTMNSLIYFLIELYTPNKEMHRPLKSYR